ncbi:MAG: hypothetical protein K2Y23_12725 [Cyanobacteria bacterium]|nr:hypothetical protein [Cyanobacteriota bacterium]
MSVFLLALMAGTSEAQGNGRYGRNQGIPPGQMPRAGMCRVWYDNLPAGRQPRETRCDQAERIASRDRNARVIYGPSTGSGPSRAWSRDGDDYYGSRNNVQRYRDRNNSNIYRDDRYGNNTNRGNGYTTVPYDNGYRDGLEKGREDAGDRDSYDPVRHSRYRSADRGYNSRYGTKESYKLAYRDGFEAGYAQAYRGRRY